MLTEMMNPIDFEQWKVEIQELLKGVATVAEERGELLRTHELDIYDTDTPEDKKVKPLGEILRTKAVSLDALFRLAVVGHFCRGKSTLINAMLNRPLLTGDLRPNTATSTVLRHGMLERFRVTFKPKSGRQSLDYNAKSSDDLARTLAEFTSDAAVASDVQHDARESSAGEQRYIDLMQGKEESLAQLIDIVEVWCYSDFLNLNRLEIIDTPGLGSVFKEHKKVTLSVIPTVDATLFLIQADPGISKREEAFLELIKEQVGGIFFVLTKADQIEKHQIMDLVDYTRDVIENIAKLTVEHIYPVSALNALQGNGDESGFEVFLPSLQQFLIKNSGIGRLSNAVRCGRGYCDQMLLYIEQDIYAQSQSLKELRDDRDKIQQTARKIKVQRDKLMATIDKRIEDIIFQALHGLESLPGKIRKNVEERVDNLNLQQLKYADDYLQPVMKDTVVGWLRENQSSFEMEMKRLIDRVKREVKEMLGDIQSTREQQLFERNFEVQLNSPTSASNLISASIGEDIVRMLSSVGITGIVADLIGGVIDVGTQVIGGIKNFFGGLFGGRRRQPQPRRDDRLRRARQKVREVLLAEVECSGKNAYEAMVEGYNTYSGRHVRGVCDAIKESFQDWGKQLQERISDLVNSNVNARLSQLDRQIEQLEKKVSEEDLMAKIEMYRTQYDRLEGFQLRLCELEASLEALEMKSIKTSSLGG